MDMNSADEEDFTVLHRLATNQIFRTSRRVTYSPRPFRAFKDAEALHSIIESVVPMGGDVDTLTSSAEAAKQKKQRSTDDSKNGYTALILAILEGDEDLVEALLSCDASVHTKNLSGETALFHTSHRANVEQPNLINCVQRLVSAGAEMNIRSPSSKSALLNAASSGLLGIFDFLLSHGADIDERDYGTRSTNPGKSVFAFFAKVNALQRRTQFIMANPRDRGEKVWFEAPWDSLQTSKTFDLQRMMERNTHTQQQSRDMRGKWDECVLVLENYGGRTSTEPEHYEAYP
ncbi:ankyrin [Ophiobolus disseminans]|uniref:Ankyrin n=1 Tax=Ophiobolus disseminans TaxID=1469910 RepID=A0A6A6ZND0_9PLEO|nr:ankyrin [Ophiobolus disseminans]